MNKTQNEILKLPKHIEVSHAEKSIEKMQIYAGHSAHTKLYHYEGRVLETINLLGYVMFRNPSSYGHWGFVIKGGTQEIAILVKVEDVCRFELYDQRIRQTIKEGEVVHIEFDWTTYNHEDPPLPKKTILNSNEFDSK